MVWVHSILNDRRARRIGNRCAKSALPHFGRWPQIGHSARLLSPRPWQYSVRPHANRLPARNGHSVRNYTLTACVAMRTARPAAPFQTRTDEAPSALLAHLKQARPMHDRHDLRWDGHRLRLRSGRLLATIAPDPDWDGSGASVCGMVAPATWST